MPELTEPLFFLIAIPLLYLFWRVARTGHPDHDALRIAIILLFTLLLANPVIPERTDKRDIVFLVDRSQSVGELASQRALETYKLVKKETDTTRTHLQMAMFGERAKAVLRNHESIHNLENYPLEQSTDLYHGLQLASSLCNRKTGSRIVIFSDGFSTGTAPQTAVPMLEQRHISVDYAPVHSTNTMDVSISKVQLPERVTVNTPFRIRFQINAANKTEGTLIIANNEQKERRKIQLEQGVNRFAIQGLATKPGLYKRTISIMIADDRRPANNTTIAATEVIGERGILLFNDNGQPDRLSRALTKADLNVSILKPAPVSSAALKHFSAVILENVPLSAFNSAADSAFRNYVRDTGGGLLITGGKSSFSSGGYYKSRLESALPVRLDNKDDFERPGIALGIVLDRSGSMGSRTPSGATKMNLANQASVAAMNVLRNEDEIAVFAVDSQPHTIIKLSSLKGQRKPLRTKILNINSGGGGIYVYNGLHAVMNELRKSQLPTRHIILFSDAADSEQPGAYKKLIGNWIKANGSISVIGLGRNTDPDAALLQDIATRGKGKAFFTTDAGALPRVFCQDAMRVARKTFSEDKTRGKLTPLLSRIGDINLSAFPVLDGFNICQQKTKADTLAVTNTDKARPLLAVQQYGTGRTAAFTGEADGKYSGALATWSDYATMFTAVVKWLEKHQKDPRFFTFSKRNGRTGEVRLEMTPKVAEKCTDARVHIITPEEKKLDPIPMQWTSKTELSASFPLKKNGIYHGVVQTREGRKLPLPVLTIPYAPEFEPRDDTTGIATLQKLSDNTGGKRVMHASDILRQMRYTASKTSRTSLAPWLAAILLVLLLTDIINRRALWSLFIPQKRPKLPSALRSITTRRKPKPLSTAYSQHRNQRKSKPQNSSHVQENDATAGENTPVDSSSEQSSEQSSEPLNTESLLKKAKSRSRKDISGH